MCMPKGGRGDLKNESRLHVICAKVQIYTRLIGACKHLVGELSGNPWMESVVFISEQSLTHRDRAQGAHACLIRSYNVLFSFLHL